MALLLVAPVRAQDTHPPASSDTVAPSAASSTWALGPLLGGAWSWAFLNPGYRAGGEILYRPDPSQDRWRLFLDVFVQGATGQGSRVIPGRGLDSALVENALLTGPELRVTYALWTGDHQQLFVSLGAGAAYVHNSFINFSAPATEEGFGLFGTGGLGYSRATGPGELAVTVGYEWGGASTGTLSQLTTPGVQSAVLTLSYLLSL